MIKNKLHAGLIGRPESDLRHTGHIGYDGAMFGDVSFIGDNYDKLPVKVVTPTRMYYKQIPYVHIINKSNMYVL
jgi:hypothetical protein